MPTVSVRAEPIAAQQREPLSVLNTFVYIVA